MVPAFATTAIGVLPESMSSMIAALDEHALCASRAQLAEHAGELEEAAALYAEAAGAG